MADINNELNQIKNAIYGKDVRGSIHDGIKKINDETEVATVKSEQAHDVMESIINDGFDNAALEANFEQRLDDEINNLQPEWTQFKDQTNQQLAQTGAEVENVKSVKMDKNTSDISVTQINKNKGKLDQTYMSDEFLQQMAGNTPINAIPADGSLTTEKYADDSITTEKISNEKLKGFVIDGVYIDETSKGIISATVNKFNKNIITEGGYYSAVSGNWVENPAWATSYPIPVENGKSYKLNHTGPIVLLNRNFEFIEGFNSVSEFTVSNADAVYVRTAFESQYIDTHMLTETGDYPIPYKYIPFGQYATDSSWVDTHVSDEYPLKNAVIAGDSIVANAGKNPTGDEVLIGYDGVLKRDLKIKSIINIGSSGSAMSGGHGVITNADIDWAAQDVFICNAGTNDFKLNKELGILEPFGATFNGGTFYGAYQIVLEYLLTQNPNLKIFLMTPAQRNNDGYTTESENTLGYKLIEYVSAVKEISQKYSANLVDVYGRSGITEYAINQYTYDGLHFNNNGYEHAGGLLVKELGG